MKKILLVEDERELGENIRDLLQALGYEVVGLFDQSSTVLAYLKQNPVDLILMDIMIKGELDGIELTEKIKASHEIPVVFITAFSDQRVLERISDGAYEGYILKPFTLQSLKSAVFLALNKKPPKKRSDLSVKNILKVRDKGYVVPVPFREILFVEADGLYTKVVTDERTYVLRGILKDVVKELDETKFIRVHKSFCINLDKVQSLNAKELTIGAYTIPIRRGFYREILNMIQN